MVGEYHDRVDAEWTFLTGHTQRIAQEVNVVDKEFGASIRERDREEKRSTRNEVASIVDHSSFAVSLPSLPAYRFAHAGYDSTSASVRVAACRRRGWPFQRHDQQAEAEIEHGQHEEGVAI